MPIIVLVYNRRDESDACQIRKQSNNRRWAIAYKKKRETL